jgi:hypothetical protein
MSSKCITKLEYFTYDLKIDGAAIIRQQNLVPTGKLNVLQQQHAWPGTGSTVWSGVR